MAKEIDLKNLKSLRSDLLREKELKSKLENNSKEKEKLETEINNPISYSLDNRKETNNRSELEKEYREILEEKCEVDSIGEILKGIYRFSILKIVLFIIMFIALVVGGEYVIQGMLDKNPALKTDPAFEASGIKFVLIAIGIMIVLVNVIPPIFNLIRRAIKLRKLKNAKYTKKQELKLKEATALDEKNAKYNEEIIKKEKPQYEEKQKNYILECKKNLEKIVVSLDKDNDELNKIKTRIEKSDCLGNQEKVLEIVDMLVYFIETKRADSIKEALQEYDKIRYNEAQLAIEQQKLVLQQQKMEQESADRKEKMEQDRRHQQEVESQMNQEARDREQMAKDIHYGTWYNTK